MPDVIHRVLAALDTSPRASRVLETAGQLAKQFGAELVLFRAIDVPQDFPPAAATRADRVGPVMLEDAERELRRLAASAGLDAATRVVASHEPWRAILDAADALDADAIVLGSHEYRRLDRLLGTAAARVADRAHCLVVVVHEPLP